MGQSQSSLSKRLQIRDSQWQYTGDQEGKTIYRNTLSGKMGEMNYIKADPKKDAQKQLQIYEYRRKQETGLVSAYGAQNTKASKVSMCGNEQNFRVLTQRIPKKLKDLNGLSFQQSLYGTCESLRGYKDCYGKVGSFHVTDRMMGVNDQGFWKVWLNENFAQNHPSIQKPILQMTQVNTKSNLGSQSEKDQMYMVHNIIELVEEKCQNGRFPEEFRSRIYSKRNFTDAYCQIQNFCVNNQINLPDRIATNGSVISIDRQLPNNSPPMYRTGSQQFIQQQPNRETYINNLSFRNSPPQLSSIQLQNRPSQLINRMNQVESPKSIYSGSTVKFNNMNNNLKRF